jgi:protein-S-isoprenylcysteine O-methyltransferase Ste14
VASWSQIARRIRVPLGFVFAGVYIWLAKPTTRSIVIGTGISVAGLFIRTLASAHVQKNEVLTISGPYAYTRHPLYLGSMVLVCGFLLAARSWGIALLAIGLFLAIYLPVIRSEEAFLRARFPEFPEYARQVPRLFPRLRPPQQSSSGFSWQLYRKHREYNAVLGTALMVAVLIGKAIWLKKP